MDETEVTNKRFEEFLETFEDFEQFLKPLLDCKSLFELSEQISLTEKAKINVALVYLLNSLYYSISKHPAFSYLMIIDDFSLYEDKRAIFRIP